MRHRLHNGRAAQGPFSSNPNELIGHFPNALFETGLLGLPRAAAKTVKQALLVAIAAQELDILNRKIER